MVLRGRYRLDSLLAVGEMAVVYAATHRNKKRLAVKMLHPELSVRPEVRVRFQRDGYAANSVDHPDAVAVLDDDVDEAGVAFVVMELLDGESVQDLCARSGDRLPLPVALSIGHRVLDVLAAAHAHGVVHRDVKPGNLFLTRRGEVKLLDFGIARVRDAASSQATPTSYAMETAGFMAPEQALGKSDDVDALTDVWAVGATVFRLASGTRVHAADSPQETLVLSATRAAPSLQTVVRDAPPVVVEAIDRALALDKAGRWPSALAMREAFRQASFAAFGGLAPLPALPERVDALPPSGATPLALESGSALEITTAASPTRSKLAIPLVVGSAVALALGVIAFADRRSAPLDHASASGRTATMPPSAPASAPAASVTGPPAAAAANALTPSANDTKTTPGDAVAPGPPPAAWGPRP
jgi:eukaryotic-like serine/threonine-protein kinase